MHPTADTLLVKYLQWPGAAGDAGRYTLLSMRMWKRHSTSSSYLMRKRKQIVGRQSLGFSCAWCQKAIPDDVELFSVGAKAKPGVDLTRREGELLDIFLEKEGRSVKAVVVTLDSPAKMEGYDLLFVACSEGCAKELKDKVGWEIGAGGERRV